MTESNYAPSPRWELETIYSGGCAGAPVLAALEEVKYVHADLTQREREVHSILKSFAHPHQPAATDLETGVLRVANRLQSFLVAVRRADTREMAPRRFEVVVDPIRSRPFQRGRLFGGQQADGHTEVNVSLGLDSPKRLAKCFHVLLRRCLAADHRTVLHGTDLGRGEATLDDLVDRPHGIAGNGGVRHGRLAAEGTILAAQPALGVAEHMKINPPSKIPVAQPEGGLYDLEQIVVRGIEHRQCFIPCQRLPVQYVFTSFDPAHAHLHFAPGPPWAYQSVDKDADYA